MELLKRIIYSVRMLHHHCPGVAAVYHHSPRQQALQHLSPPQLQQQGIRILALDFDGVLAAYGEIQPTQESVQWLSDSVATFGSDHVFILSNNPMSDRIAYFKQHFPGVRFVLATQKKPYPDGLDYIVTLTHQPRQAIMLIDDRLLTGVLAACIANVRVTYITHPYICLRKRPIQESFFMGLRFLEKSLIKGYSLF